MGAAGPLAKNQATKQGHHTPVTVQVVDEPAVIPAPPKGLKQEVKDIWERMWMSPLGRAWSSDMDGPLIERYARTLHNWMNAQRQLANMESVITIGSQGQPVLHPLTTYINQLEQTLGRIEKELGMTPMSRARLGLTIAETELTAAQLNQTIKSRIGQGVKK